MYNQRVTDTAVYFVGGPFSQWFPSFFIGKLTADGPDYEFNCCEQYMMASKAALMGDAAAVTRILAIVPEGGNAAFFADLASPDEAVVKAAHKRFKGIPRLQKDAGKTVAPFNQALWDKYNDKIVLRGNFYKFSQNPHLLRIILGTEARLLVEGASYDRIWGVGLDWSDPLIEDERNWRGQNKLGKALMEARDILVRWSALPMTPRVTFNPFTMSFE